VFSAGKPAPTVSWYRNDKFVNNRTTTVRNGVTRSEIAVQNLDRDDVHSVLTCNATNNNRSKPLSSSVGVDMNCKYPAGWKSTTRTAGTRFIGVFATVRNAESLRADRPARDSLSSSESSDEAAMPPNPSGYP
jgi:hypothetical protein